MNFQDKSTRDDALKRLRDVSERVVRDGSVVARIDSSEHQVFPVAVSAAEGQSLRDWIIREKASCTIEIGLAYGVSALFVCEGLLINVQNELQNAPQEGLPDVSHVVIDPFQSTGFKNCGLQLLEDAGVRDLVEYHCEESQILLPRLLSEGRTFELAFVDGSHFFDRVFLDLIYLGRLVQPGNIILVDDYQLPAITRAVSFCVTNLGWVVEEISSPDKHVRNNEFLPELNKKFWPVAPTHAKEIDRKQRPRLVANTHDRW